MSYVLTFGEGEYVESYFIGAKELSSTYRKEDALVLIDKSHAEFLAERIGCKVEKL